MRRLFAAGLAGTALLVGTAVPAAADHSPYVTHHNYLGYRFAEGRICFEDRADTLRTRGQSGAVLNAVQDITTKTPVDFSYRYGYNSCAGAKQRIILVDAYYGTAVAWHGKVFRRGTCSETVRQNCTYWGETPMGHSTWLVKDYLVVAYNLSYGSTYAGVDHIITHELGHGALAVKDRPTWSNGSLTCASIMAYCAPGSGYAYLDANTDAWATYILGQ